MPIDDDEKTENTGVENSLIEKVRIKNESEEEQEKNITK